LTVQFIYGKEKSFEFDPQVHFGEGSTTKLKEMLSSNALIVQMKDELEIILFANIQNILVTPANPELLKKIKTTGALVSSGRG